MSDHYMRGRERQTQRAFRVMAQTIDELIRRLEALDSLKKTLDVVQYCIICLTVLLYTIVLTAAIVFALYMLGFLKHRRRRVPPSGKYVLNHSGSQNEETSTTPSAPQRGKEKTSEEISLDRSDAAIDFKKDHGPLPPKSLPLIPSSVPQIVVEAPPNNDPKSVTDDVPDIWKDELDFSLIDPEPEPQPTAVRKDSIPASQCVVHKSADGSSSKTIHLDYSEV